MTVDLVTRWNTRTMLVSQLKMRNWYRCCSLHMPSWEIRVRIQIEKTYNTFLFNFASSYLCKPQQETTVLSLDRKEKQARINADDRGFLSPFDVVFFRTLKSVLLSFSLKREFVVCDSSTHGWCLGVDAETKIVTHKIRNEIGSSGFSQIWTLLSAHLSPYSSHA